MPPTVTFERVLTNGVELQCVVAGEGPLLFLLHGFPEFWQCWEKQIPELAKEFRVIAPDLRGYASSDKPVVGYSGRVLANDILGLINHYAGPDEPVRIAGHDWGGYVAWFLAYLAPERLKRITVLNSPHPWMYQVAIFTSSQIWRLWYVLFFQIPCVAEWFIGRKNGAGAVTVLRVGSNGFAFPSDYLDAIRREITKPGAPPATLEYYRTAARYGLTGVSFMRGITEVPVQIIWGTADPALSVSLTHHVDRHAPNVQVDLLPNIGHYVTHEAPDRVTELLLGWMRQL